MKKKANLLIDETSPYLLIHAHNPIQWHPWCQSALEKAKNENLPIFLSIGYHACHWSLVMERECFNDDEIALELNKSFVSIKVDREERPDLDDIYMASLEAITGQTGWPMSLFLTPSGYPFFAGTTFSKYDSPQRPGFLTVVKSIAKAWKTNQKSLIIQGEAIINQIKELINEKQPTDSFPFEVLDWSLEALDQKLDSKEGGFGAAPKFPGALKLDLYIEYLNQNPYQRKIKRINNHLETSLTKMAFGGIYDQLGGGFHRYSTDEIWMVPHFEKMLYDNALLARTFFEASQLKNRDFYERIGKEVCNFILLEMTHENGGFYSSISGDSEGIEGKYFLWDRSEIIKTLGEKDGESFCQIFDVIDPSINWDQLSFKNGSPPHDWFYGKILHLKKDLTKSLLEVEKTQKDFEGWKNKLLQKRLLRVSPSKDKKIITSWNSLMCEAMVKAYQITGVIKYLKAAQKNNSFIWNNLQTNGRIKTSWKDDKTKNDGNLDDYSFYAKACLELYKVTSDRLYLERAIITTENVLKFFKDPASNTFFFTPSDGESLIYRSKSIGDSSIPNGNSILAGVLIRLSHLLKQNHFLTTAKSIFNELSLKVKESPHLFSSLIREYILFENGPKEIILINGNDDLKSFILKGLKPQEYFLTEKNENIPALKGKSKNRSRNRKSNSPLLYECTDGVCISPKKGEKEIREFWEKTRFSYSN
ncbi:MAG: hypothetical protein CME68_00740 [Halobacteriovoraceae bacterium]|nr:hypothetical protein [Halobacteriovoraceae bacterium]